MMYPGSPPALRMVRYSCWSPPALRGVRLGRLRVARGHRGTGERAAGQGAGDGEGEGETAARMGGHQA